MPGGAQALVQFPSARSQGLVEGLGSTGFEFELLKKASVTASCSFGQGVTQPPTLNR